MTRLHKIAFTCGKADKLLFGGYSDKSAVGDGALDVPFQMQSYILGNICVKNGRPMVAPTGYTVDYISRIGVTSCAHYIAQSFFILKKVKAEKSAFTLLL